jgi:uncharacterized damage-inducible protein DinB
MIMANQSETIFTEFIRYNNWANRQVLAACQKLSEAELAAPIPGAYGTLRETLEHIIRAEASYVGRLTGKRPQPPFKWEDGPGLVEMTAFAAQVGDALEEMARRVPPEQFVYEEDEGEKFRYQALAIFIQIINHGVEHRTNITTVLNQAGQSPPEVDGWGYLWEHKDRFRMEWLDEQKPA